MRVLGIDFETTGLDTATARITEMGAVLWDVGSKKPLLLKSSFLHDDALPQLSDDIVRLTGLTDEILQEFGTSPTQNFRWLESFCEKHQVEYFVAHNGENFDRPLLYAELTRADIHTSRLRDLPWIDTRTDLPFLSEPDSRKLKHLALDCGFINPFPHRAVFDVLTMLRVFSQFPVEDVLTYQRIPFVTLRACVGYEQRELAKKQRYAWEKIGEKVYPKFWVKRVKENLMEAELATCKQAGFDVIRIE